MTDLSKIDMRQAQPAAGSSEQMGSGLERADLLSARYGQSLHNQIGRRLRNVFSAPEEQDDAFDRLLKQISSRLP